MSNYTYKPSIYNFYFSDGDSAFLYNSFSNAFVKLNGEMKLDWLGTRSTKISKPKNSFIDKWSPLRGLYKHNLIEGGFVVKQETDENSLLKIKNKISRFSQKILPITVVLTTRCNMSCMYCFEDSVVNNKYDTMNNVVADNLLLFIENNLKQGSNYVNITWYGGEPLLCLKTIKYLTRKIVTLCKSYNAKYRFGMTSNGSLLTKDVAIALSKLFIEKIQITLAGTEEKHNVRRPLKSGKNSYRTVLANIVEASKYLNITIRCNVDQGNATNIKNLINELAEYNLANKVTIYFAPVHAGCDNRLSKCLSGSPCNVITPKDFAPLEVDLKRYAGIKGFNNQFTLPCSKESTCYADKLNGFVIEPTGSIQKCCEHIGCKSEEVGSLPDGIIVNNQSLKWLHFDPFSISQCKKCKILPLCMGGCPARIMNNEKHSMCPTFRYNMVELLKRYEATKSLTTV